MHTPKIRTNRFFQSNSSNSPSSSSKHKSHDDRFIRSRSNSPRSSQASERSSSYESIINEMFEGSQLKTWTIEKMMKKHNQIEQTKVIRRNICPVIEFQIFDWQDDYYSSLLDWSNTNTLCAAGYRKIILYNMNLGKEEVKHRPENIMIGGFGQFINSIKFSPHCKKIVLGYSGGSFFSYDYQHSEVEFTHCLNYTRINCIDWFQHSIYTGSKDSSLHILDDRTYQVYSKIHSIDHSQICGVKVSNNYFAVGTNDCNVKIFDKRKASTVMDAYQHLAAVKALDWQTSTRLISGGGSKDKKIKFWKLSQGVSANQINTGSQICSLVTSKKTSQIVSCQGFSYNSIVIWNKRLKRQLTVHGHNNRVLWSALSPEGTYLATGAGDKSLKIWKLFDTSDDRSQLGSADMR